MLAPSEAHSPARSPLRWAGGKRFLLSFLHRRLPLFRPGDIYIEPFLGAGHLYFSIATQVSAVLNDVNADLIECFEQIRRDPDSFALALRRHARNYSEDYFYQVRERYNKSRSVRLRALYFLFLNRTCYNGVYRVNREGHLNTSFGYLADPWFPSREDLRSIASLLDRATLLSTDFANVIEAAPSDSVIFVDPPYPSVGGSSDFNRYTVRGFSHSDQERLASALRLADRQGIRFIQTNADTPAIRRLYRGFRIESLLVRRRVTSLRVRHMAKEIVVRNY